MNKVLKKIDVEFLLKEYAKWIKTGLGHRKLGYPYKSAVFAELTAVSTVQPSIDDDRAMIIHDALKALREHDKLTCDVLEDYFVGEVPATRLAQVYGEHRKQIARMIDGGIYWVFCALVEKNKKAA